MTIPVGAPFAALTFASSQKPLCGDSPETINALFRCPPCVTLRATTIDAVMPTLRQASSFARQGHTVVGAIAYEAASAFDPAMPTHPPCLGQPLVAFHVFAEDNPAVCTPSESPFALTPWIPTIRTDGFYDNVARIRASIAEGAFYQANLTYGWQADFTGDPYALWCALREAQPQSYGFYANFGTFQIASVSPELFFAWDRATRLLVTQPMKGTVAPERAHAGEYLQTTRKERAENLMIVDLLRNDMSRIAKKGSVHVPELFTIHTLPTAVQMTSTIVAETTPDVDVEAIIAALFPCGSITGAPKIAAMHALQDLEAHPRGFYCGALGVITPKGACFSVGIRTVVVQQGQATCGVGGGITWDSDPHAEEAETRVKRRFLMRATAPFSLFTTMRLEDGAFFLWERHRARLQRSAHAFGFPFKEAVCDAMGAALSVQYPQGLWRVKVIVDRDGAMRSEVTAYQHHVVQDPQRVALAMTPVEAEDEFLHHKTTHRSVYDRRVRTDIPDLFDTLLWNEAGEVTEFTRGNLVAEINGVRVTPPLACGVLDGTLRGMLVESGAVMEGVIRLEDLQSAHRLWFVNGLRGEVPVVLREPLQSSATY